MTRAAIIKQLMALLTSKNIKNQKIMKQKTKAVPELFRNLRNFKCN